MSNNVFRSDGSQEIKTDLRITRHLPEDSNRSQPCAPLIGHQPICPSVTVMDKPQTLLSVLQPVCPSASPSIVSLSTLCCRSGQGRRGESQASVAEKEARAWAHALWRTNGLILTVSFYAAGRTGERINVERWRFEWHIPQKRSSISFRKRYFCQYGWKLRLGLVGPGDPPLVQTPTPALNWLDFKLKRIFKKNKKKTHKCIWVKFLCVD